MEDPFTDKEWIEANDLLDYLDDFKIADELIRLADREKVLLSNQQIDPEIREIIVYNFTVLLAAVNRLKILGTMEKEVKESTNPE